MSAIIKTTATIANGASLSDAVNIAHADLFAIEMPAAWTAASMTFQGSYDGSTYSDLYDDAGTEIAFTVDASRYVLIRTPAQFFGLKKLKVRSGASASAVNQGGARTINLIVCPDA
jgi:hypothetical protein